MIIKQFFERRQRIKRYGQYLTSRYDAIVSHVKDAPYRMLMGYPHVYECDLIIQMLEEEGYNVERWKRLPVEFYEKNPDAVPIMITW